MDCAVTAAGRPLPAEDVYGHRKKVLFFLDALRRAQARTEGPVRVLDFGCGSGVAVSQYLIGDGVEFTGIDFHPPSLEYARRHFGGAHARFFESLPEAGDFDIMVYGDVLEHLDDPAAVLAEHVRRLAPGGVVVGSVPNGYGGFENERRLDRLLHLSDAARWLPRTARRALGRPPTRPAPEVPFNEESGHVVFFTRLSLDQTLTAAGLTITRFAHGSFVGADLSGSTILKPRILIALNAWIADRLPAWAVSTWHFEATRPGEGDSSR